MIKLSKILYPTDFSELSLHSLHYARSFCRTYQASLHCLHVVDEALRYWMAMGPSEIPAGVATEDLLKNAELEMARFKERHLGDVPYDVLTKVTVGSPFVEIVRYAREQAIDMIVMATHGRSGLSHVLMGSVAERVVRGAPCPVLSIRNPQHEFIMP